MTDRINALVVVLDKDTRSDDLEPLINAIQMMKGVVSVASNVANMESHIAYSRVRTELGRKVLKVLWHEGEDK